jgi:hypothetical protein
VTLHLKSTTKAAKFEYADGRMTVSWDVDASLADDELVDELRRIVNFYDAQTGREVLPERIPGMALGVAQTQYPAPAGGVDPGIIAALPPANGWAATTGVVPTVPEIPEDRKGQWELIPPEEQG